MSQANNQELIWQGNFSLSLAYIMPVDKRGSNYIMRVVAHWHSIATNPVRGAWKHTQHLWLDRQATLTRMSAARHAPRRNDVTRRPITQSQQTSPAHPVRLFIAKPVYFKIDGLWFIDNWKPFRAVLLEHGHAIAIADYDKHLGARQTRSRNYTSQNGKGISSRAPVAWGFTGRFLIRCRRIANIAVCRMPPPTGPRTEAWNSSAAVCTRVACLA